MSGSAAALYLVWPSNRVMRDHLEPLMLTNADRAHLTVRQQTVDLQVVDHKRYSVFQRTFHAGFDYRTSASEPPPPPASPRPLPITTTAVGAEPLFAGVIEMRTIADILAGIRHHHLHRAAAASDKPQSDIETAPSPKEVKSTGRVDHGAVWRVGGGGVALRLRQATPSEWYPLVVQSRVSRPSEVARGGGGGGGLDLESLHGLGPGAGRARISMRTCPDLRDDILDLSLFGHRCHISVHNAPAPRLGLVAQHKSGHVSVEIVYQRAPDHPASSSSNSIAVAAAPDAAARPVGNVGKKVPPAKPTQETVRHIPYFQIDMDGPAARQVATSVRLRPIPILHKLIGSSSRMEWLVRDKGPVTCAFFQATGGAERRTGLLLAAPAPAPPILPVPSPSLPHPTPFDK